MLGISTAWCSMVIDNGVEIIKRLLEYQVDGIELEYRITGEIFRQMRPLLGKEAKVLSIHNYFPVPEILKPSEASADAFRLSALDKEERELAVRYTIKTIQVAEELEVPFVVVHPGEIEIEHQSEKLMHYFDEGQIDSPESQKLIEGERKKRGEKRGPNLDALFFSLEKVNREAQRRAVYLGLENRYYYHQIPDAEEIGMILKKFSGSNLRYWHDTGHARVLENLGGWVNHRGIISRYGGEMIGIHLHDVKGYSDHRAPGTGELDFIYLKEALPEKIPKIIECHALVAEEELKEGIKFLRERGF